MRQFNKIAIIGVGLIGGSIGLAVKKRRLAGEVTGVFRRSSTLKKALRAKAVDRGTMNIEDGVTGADLVILASPVSSIPDLAYEVVKYAKKGTLITDVGSTKGWIVDEIERIVGLRPSVSYVGSHPMAGSEHAGVEFARPDLLDNSPCIVTKTKKTKIAALKRIIAFWASLGAEVKVMDPGRHDRIVSLISHLPHLVAFSLVGAVPAETIACAAEGFKDTTRIASSDPALWADTFLTNKKEVAIAARTFAKYFNGLVKTLLKGDRRRIIRALKRSKSKRDKFVHGKGS